MAKLTLTNIASGFVSIDALNANNTAIETALENTLSRDGTTPNQMLSSLDMNSNRIINLPEPLSANEAARLQDVIDASMPPAEANTTTFTPYAYVSSTTVQTAIQDVIDASLLPVAFTPYANISSTTVQTAIQEEIDDLAAPSGSSLLGFLQSGTGTVSRTSQDKMRETVSVKDFGAVGDGITDDTAAIQAALTDATLNSYRLDVGSGIYKINSGLLVDLGKMSLIGYGAKFDFSGMAAGYAIQIFSSQDFAGSMINQTNELRGIFFQGPNATGKHGLKYGHATYAHCNDLRVIGCSFRQFDRNIEFIDNAWRCNFVDVRSEDGLSYNLYNPSGLINAGEAMRFTGCMLVDGDVPVLLAGGQWDFDGCSLLNANIVVQGDTQVTWTGGNMENPGNPSTGWYFVDTQGDDSLFVFNGGRVVLNDPSASGGTIWNRALFKSSSSMGGIHFGEGFRFPSGSPFFYPETTEGERLLVAGTGRVTMSGGVTFSGIVANSDLIVAKSLNRLYNGGAELGATTGWSITPYGTAGSTFTATAGSKYLGTYGFYVNCVASGGVSVIQTVPASPGSLVILNAWARKLSGTADCVILMYFLDSLGNTISSQSQLAPLSASFSVLDLAGICPIGTTSVRVEINGQASATPVQAYVDALVLNVL